jgi:hypothetical protein
LDFATAAELPANDCQADSRIIAPLRERIDEALRNGARIERPFAHPLPPALPPMGEGSKLAKMNSVGEGHSNAVHFRLTEEKKKGPQWQ